MFKNILSNDVSAREVFVPWVMITSPFSFIDETATGAMYIMMNSKMLAKPIKNVLLISHERNRITAYTCPKLYLYRYLHSPL
jgi:hypothetical protein